MTQKELDGELQDEEIEEIKTTTEEDLEKLFLYKNRFDTVMNYNNPYYQFISEIMQKTLIMKLKQLILFTQKKFAISDLKANELILEAQKYNYIIITKDEYVMTNGYYLSKFDDQFFDGLSYNNYFMHYEKNIKPSLTTDELNNINCYTIIANMMPVSEKFFIPSSPWNIAFVTPSALVEEGKIGNLFEIIYIPHSTSTALCYALAEKYREKKEEIAPFIKRIAIVEDENDIIKIPYIGFTNIVKVNMENFTILEDRRDNPWG